MRRSALDVPLFDPVQLSLRTRTLPHDVDAGVDDQVPPPLFFPVLLEPGEWQAGGSVAPMLAGGLADVPDL
jgi:hypothetical protein